MNSTTNVSRKETERTKLIQEKCQSLLTQMLRDEDNKYCVDCDAKGPRWASWNLGVFLCIRCAGIHRNLGVHISRVKSVNLDTWTPEQVISLQQMGNSRARAVYEAQLPDGFRRPQTDTALESFIRAKYEHKKYLAREWVPSLPPKVDWAKEVDEELEKQKRKKKAAQATSALGFGVTIGTDKKFSSSAKPPSLPAPLPKPKGQNSSPKAQRISTTSMSAASSQTNDLLGLSSPTKQTQSNINAGIIQDSQNDSFSGFLCATNAVHSDKRTESNINIDNSTKNILAKEEEDFFNQGYLSSSIGDKDKSGKLTTDSILALYRTAPPNTPTTHTSHNQQINYSQPQQMFAATSGFTGMTPGYMGGGGVVPHLQQFMTPPNSASMYNAPVMTAPTAFSAPGLNMHISTGNSSAVFSSQFPVQNLGGTGNSGFAQQVPVAGMISGGGGIVSTGQPSAAHLNLIQANQGLISGPPTVGAPIQMTPVQRGGINVPMPVSGISSMGVMSTPSPFHTQGTGSTGNINQQFENLNIGNVWQ